MPVMVVKKKKGQKKQQRVRAKKQQSVGLLGQGLRALGGLGGGALGGYFGAPGTGSAVGTSLGAALSKWLGAGDYTVVANSMLHAGPTIPAMHSSGQSIVVRHKEYLGPVVGSANFTVQSVYTLNPGLVASFPWLSRIAACFQEYTFKGAVFHYVPTSGVAISGTNPAIGSVMMQTSYRSTESSPTTKIELLNEYWASEAAPNETFAHPIECQPAENPFKVQYVRSSTVGTDSPLMYDLGKTFVATQGMPADGNPVGDLWITYEVELRKPVVKSNVTPGTFYASALTNGTTSGGPLFSNMIWAPSTTGITSTGLSMSFPSMVPGDYLYDIAIQTQGSNFSGTSEFSGSLTVTNGTELSYQRNVFNYATGATSSRVMRSGFVRVADFGPVVITWPAPALVPSTSLIVSFNIVQLPT